MKLHRKRRDENDKLFSINSPRKNDPENQIKISWNYTYVCGFLLNYIALDLIDYLFLPTILEPIENKTELSKKHLKLALKLYLKLSWNYPKNPTKFWKLKKREEIIYLTNYIMSKYIRITYLCRNEGTKILTSIIELSPIVTWNCLQNCLKIIAVIVH